MTRKFFGVSCITCIVANKDSRTLYVADAGYIKRIDSGELTTIAGPKFWQNDPGGGQMYTPFILRYQKMKTHSIFLTQWPKRSGRSG